MRNKIVLVPFIYDDLSGVKVRPAVCLTDVIKPYSHVVVAFITSKQSSPSNTDIVIEATDPDFPQTGLKVTSTVRIHHLTTIERTLIRRKVGELSENQQAKIRERLRTLFNI